MSSPERVEFIAERPNIFDNHLTMPWPSDDVFQELRADMFPEIDTETIDEEDDENWPYRNAIYGLKDEYFRMRYRGASWPFEKFSGEALADDDAQKLDQFLVHGYWSPAAHIGSRLYQETGEDKYRQAAIYACGLHIYDAINHSWGFLDARLSNDSRVREKHFLVFLETIAEVSNLPMSDTEAAYFKPLQQQYNLAFAEMAAQSPVTASRDLQLFDPQAREADEYMRTMDKSRSSMINFVDADDELKIRIVERFKRSAIQSLSDSEMYSSPVFALECLHLFGLAYVPDFYRDGGEEPAWWRLSAEEIMRGDTTNLKTAYNPNPQTADSSFDQDSLF